MKSGRKPILIVLLNLAICFYLGLAPLFALTVLILLVAHQFKVNIFWFVPALVLLLIRAPEISLVTGVGASVMMMQLWSVLRQPRSAFLHELASVTWFASLPAGPIHRNPALLFGDDRSQIGNEQIYLRFAGGFLKCSLGLLLFQHLRQFELFIQVGSLPTILTLCVYSILLFYCQLSGMTDIAISVSNFFGVQLPENFDHPEKAANLTDFWRRWHASLNQWFFHEVYFPLAIFFQRAVPRFGSFFAVAVLFLTAVLVGLWHGMTWTFLIWGTVNGLLLVLLRYFTGPLGTILSWIGIFFLFLLMRLKSPTFLPTLAEKALQVKLLDLPFLGISWAVILLSFGLIFICNHPFRWKSRWWPLFVGFFFVLGFLIGHPNGNVLYPGF